MPAEWRPNATLDSLRSRAESLATVREFFAERGVLEVETPLLAHHTVTDPSIESYVVSDPGGTRAGYLQTSPEFAMKRLLAANSGPIYQVCKAFRVGEAGRWHNPEFTMLEWYRPGFDHRTLMAEVEALVNCVLDTPSAPSAAKLTYAGAFAQYLDIDIDTVKLDALQGNVFELGYRGDPLPFDACLDYLLSHVLTKELAGRRVFIYDYPATQSALARLSPLDPRRAERFELFIDGVELANGFHELRDSREQQERFERDIYTRQARQLPDLMYDARLLDALEAGIPECAGVALGLDRLIAIRTGAKRIEDILSFGYGRA